MKNYLLLCVFVYGALSLAMDNEVIQKEYFLNVSFIVIPDDGVQESHVCSEKCIQYADNIVNASVLGVDVNSWFSGVKATYASSCEQRQHTGDTKKAITDLQKISSDIPEHCHAQSFFEKLQIKNIHVAYLFNTLINSRVLELKNVTGYTLDDVLNSEKTISGLSKQMNNFIYLSAQKQYEQEMFLDKSMTEIPFDEAEKEIHFTSLKSWRASEIDTISIVVNGNYVKGISLFFKSVFWDVINGSVIDEEKNNCRIEDFSNYPSCRKNSYVYTNNYLVVHGLGAQLPSASKTLTTFKQLRRSSLDESVLVPVVKLSKILLFQRPTFTSSLCKRALENSNSVKELESLRDCSVVRTLQGFTASNLAEKINSKIQHMKSSRYCGMNRYIC